MAILCAYWLALAPKFRSRVSPHSAPFVECYPHRKKERGLLHESETDITRLIAIITDSPHAQKCSLNTAMIYELDQSSIEAVPHRSGEGPTDEQLMGLIKQKDDSALEMLYRRHTRLLRSIVARALNNEYDIDDAIQDIFLEIWHQAGRYDEGKGKALGWIVTLARRRSIDRLRKKLSYGRVEERFRVEIESGFGTGTPKHAVHDVVATSEIAIVLNRLLNTLPAAQSQALRMSYYGGLSQREIASKTGIPLGTIKTRLELAMRKLRQSILSIGGRAEWGFAEA